MEKTKTGCYCCRKRDNCKSIAEYSQSELTKIHTRYDGEEYYVGCECDVGDFEIPFIFR